MTVNFDKALGVHQFTLGIRAERAEVLASNIANADTPHYKARDVDFAAALQSAQSRQQGASMNRTHEKHFELGTSPSQSLAYQVPNQPDTGDGNTVDMQRQQASFMENSLEYQMSLDFLSSKFSGLRKAIRGD